jgi:ABC-type Na+ efflux pump permease subunit
LPKVLLIAWREFKHTALTRAFIIGAVFTPVAIFAVMLLMPLLLKTTIPPLNGKFAVVDPTGAWTPAIEFELQPDQLNNHAAGIMERIQRGSADPLPAPDVSVEIQVQQFDQSADIDELKEKVRDGEFLALASINSAALSRDFAATQNNYELYVPTNTVPKHTELLQNICANAVVRARVQGAGMNLESARSIVQKPQVLTKRLSPAPRKTNGTTRNDIINRSENH